jgi:hypothetical protein
MGVSRCHGVLDTKEKGHEFMTPVRRSVKEITHQHLKGNDGNGQQGHANHHLAYEYIGFLHGCHKFFQAFHPFFPSRNIKIL